MSETAERSDLVPLATLVRDCSVSGVARRALLLRTDLLPERLSRPHHLRLAEEALEPLTRADRAQRYDLGGGRIAISWRGEEPERLQRALGLVQHLLADLPAEAPKLFELARVFELPRDGAALMALAARPALAAPKVVPAGRPAPASRPLLTLEPAQIEDMEQRLSKASVARFARRRMVGRAEGEAFVPAWETRFLSIGELMTDLAPGYNAFADPWLFRRLTRMLDRRMLSLLSAPAELRGAGPFSLDLNVGGVLSPEFMRFDGQLPQALRGQAILNLQLADVMSDVPAYRFARAFGRARGYRVVLRGVTPMVMDAVDLAELDVDFVELRWSPTLAGLDPARLRAGSAQWVLARVDDADAVRWGLGAGIALFGGEAVQHVAARRGAERAP